MSIPINTFSIVAHDPDEGAWGVAVASKFLAAGAVVSWASAGVGAIATQSYAKVGFGPDGLALMSDGKTAEETLELLLQQDSNPQQRQVGIVDRFGSAAAHTGDACHDWAGHRLGEGFTCQGNILTGGDTLDAMAEAFGSGNGELADRLVEALMAGDTIGGDKRGKQSAAVLVVRPNGGYGGDTDRYLDLRVDDDPEPVARLRDLVQTHHLFFGTPEPDDQMFITETIARELQKMLVDQGYGGDVDGNWDQPSRIAFWSFVGNENLEERWNLTDKPDHIDRVALEYLRRKFS